jgi:glucokinase
MKKVLAIDVGGTKIASAIVNSNLKVSEVKLAQTPQNNLVSRLVEIIDSYSDYQAIGLGLPGQVLFDGTVVRLPSIRNFKSFNLKKYLAKRYKKPIGLLNDAKAFALAEALVGTGKKLPVVAGVILGTGIGVGIIVDQKIHYGKDSIAGEYVHTTLLDGKKFGRYRSRAGFFKNANQAQKYLKTLFDMIILSFNPNIIVLGGGWSNLPNMERVANKLTRNVAEFRTYTPVKISKLKHASIIGAALPLLRK